MMLVLLPGMDGTGILFKPFVAALPAGLRTTIVHYPVDRQLNYVELERHVRAALPDSQPFLLVAESFSGPIAVSIAAAPPAKLQGVVLCCSFVRSPRPMLRWLASLATLVPARLVPSRISSHFLLGRFATPALRRMLSDALARTSASVLRHRAQAVLAVDVTRPLAQVRLPLLYLRASRDRVVPARAALEVNAHCPSASITEIDGPHLLLQAAPAQAADAIVAFAARLAQAANNKAPDTGPSSPPGSHAERKTLS